MTEFFKYFQLHFLEALTAIGALWAAWATTGTMKEAQKQSAYERTPFLRLKWKQAERAMIELGQKVPITPGTKDFINLFNVEFSDIEVINEGRGLARNITFKPIDTPDADVFIKDLAIIPPKGVAQLKFEETVSQSEKFYCRQTENNLLHIEIEYHDIENDFYKAIFETDIYDSDGFRLVRQGRKNSKQSLKNPIKADWEKIH